MGRIHMVTLTFIPEADKPDF